MLPFLLSLLTSYLKALLRDSPLLGPLLDPLSREAERGLAAYLQRAGLQQLLQTAARRAQEYLLDPQRRLDPDLHGLFHGLDYGSLPSVQRALADLPNALDLASLRAALRTALQNDLPGWPPEKIETAAGLCAEALLRAAAALQPYTLPILIQLAFEHAEHLRRVTDNLDDLRRALQDLARRAEPPAEPLLSDDQALHLYLEQLSARAARYAFPLGGLQAPLSLPDLYQPLPLRRAPGHAAARPEGLNDLLRLREMFLLTAALGRGKSTSLQYLAWRFSHRPQPDELIPFWLTASDLAAAWQSGARLTRALALAAAGGERPWTSPLLVEQVLQAALAQQNALLLIDALDEYCAPDSERLRLLRDLQRAWQAAPYAGNPLLLTSRPYGLRNPGLTEYLFSPLEREHLEGLVENLGRAVLRARSPAGPPPDAASLAALRAAILENPRLSAFAAPFYLTLMVLLACRAPALDEGLALLRSLERLADLYLYFLRQTIQWETLKPGASPLPVDEDTALLVLAWRARLSLPDPDLLPDLEPPLPPDRLQPVLEFWLRAGLLERDDFTLEWRFSHQAFAEFGRALWLAEAWQQGQRAAVYDLRRRFGQSPDWDTAWLIFDGLIARRP